MISCDLTAFDQFVILSALWKTNHYILYFFTLPAVCDFRNFSSFSFHIFRDYFISFTFVRKCCTSLLPVIFFVVSFDTNASFYNCLKRNKLTRISMSSCSVLCIDLLSLIFLQCFTDLKNVAILISVTYRMLCPRAFCWITVVRIKLK